MFLCYLLWSVCLHSSAVSGSSSTVTTSCASSFNTPHIRQALNCKLCVVWSGHTCKNTVFSIFYLEATTLIDIFKPNSSAVLTLNVILWWHSSAMVSTCKKVNLSWNLNVKFAYSLVSASFLPQSKDLHDMTKWLPLSLCWTCNSLATCARRVQSAPLLWPHVSWYRLSPATWLWNDKEKGLWLPPMSLDRTVVWKRISWWFFFPVFCIFLTCTL